LLIRPLVVVFLLLPGLLAGAASAAETGVVEEVVDGDTLRVRTGGSAEAVTVRLIGIDAPERSHPSLGKEFFSDESASHLASLCRGKTVRMEKDAEEADRHDRLLRYVFLTPPDGRLLNEEMLRTGMARSYTGTFRRRSRGSCGCGESCRIPSSPRKPGTGGSARSTRRKRARRDPGPGDGAHRKLLPRSGGRSSRGRKPTATGAKRSSSRGRSCGPTGRRR